MVERNINHIPITEGDTIIGVVTHTDILRQQSRSPLVLPHLLERARTTNDLYAYTQQVDNTAGALLEEGARASDIGRLVAIANDALIVHLLKQAEHEFGPPPCAYAWLVMGSEGRLEQTVRTDQDNALVYANDAPAEAESYFERLAGHVVEQLIACGFPPCPGDIMATNPQWRQPLHVWQNYFERWINNPNEEALLRSAIFFDYRKVHGALDIESALRPVIREGRSNRIFLGRMARNLLRQTPPLGMFRNFVLEKSGESRDLLDLKERGVAIIVDLARLYALEAGSSESNTLARLRTSAGKSSLDKANAEKLTSAFELMSLFRIRHQYQQIGRNEEPDNLVPVSSLSKLEQRDLKEAFRAVSTSQRSVEFTFQTSMFG
jgi:CBS domain-containing protein